MLGELIMVLTELPAGFWYAWIGFSLAVGIGSRAKGGSFVSGFVVSLVISPLIAGAILLVRPANSEALEKRAISSGKMVRCEHCRELIRPGATKCRHCGELVT